MSVSYSPCRLCPRECGADRKNGQKGFCGASDRPFVSKVMLHKYEEPCICRKNGAGAVFFSGCVLKCVFCQNKEISRSENGKAYDADGLCSLYLGLRDSGASCIDLVTPTHYAPTVIRSLEKARPFLDIPVVYNCGGYERSEVIKELKGLVDVFLPDLKYFSPVLSMKFSSCRDYFEKAEEAITAMVDSVGRYEEKDGLAQKGVVVRHLVLPGHRDDSLELLERLAKSVGTKDIRLSLMSQYTPFYTGKEFPELKRRLTSFEYSSVLKKARELGFEGFCQDRSSADAGYTPDFRTENG